MPAYGIWRHREKASQYRRRIAHRAPPSVNVRLYIIILPRLLSCPLAFVIAVQRGAEIISKRKRNIMLSSP